MTVRAHIGGGVGLGFLEHAAARRIGRVTLYLLAVLGVPAAVVVLTGGPPAIVYWIDVIMFAVFSFSIAPAAFWILLVFPFALIMWILSKVLPAAVDRVASMLTVAIWVIGGTICFLVMGPVPDSTVTLPTNYPQLGALIVLGVAALPTAGLLAGARRLGPERRTVTPALPPAHPAAPLPWLPSLLPNPQEPVEEFWSPEPVNAWRAWQWNGIALRGVITEWRGQEFEAQCDACHEPPGWAHPCGIYAVSHPADLATLFLGDPDVVGRVALSGLVIEHEIGYRASHARILDLWTTSSDVAAMLSVLYPEVTVHQGHPPDDEGEISWPT
jgi:hypothetical protein